MSSDDEKMEGSYLSEDETGERELTAEDDLWDAVKCGDASAVRQAISKGADLDYPSDNLTTPLINACRQGFKEIVHILLDAGADARWTSTFAILVACSDGHLSIVETLINHDNGLLDYVGDYGLTPLILAIDCQHSDILHFLLERGANVLVTNSDHGATTLMYACQGQNLEIVRRLLAAGVNVEARDANQDTALHIAADCGSIEVMCELILVHNANMLAMDNDGETPFELACKTDRADNVGDLLLEIYCSKIAMDHGQLALHVLLSDAEYSFPEDSCFHPPRNYLQIRLPLGKLTLKHWRTLFHTLDTDLIHNRDDNGKLPIHIARGTNAPFEVLAIIVALDPAMLQIADHSGALPLHECCRGSVDCSSVKYLVEQGGVGTLVARNHQGALPLHILCGSLDPSLRAVQYLVQSFPGSLVAQTNAGHYPFMIAASQWSTSLSVVYDLVRASPNLVV